MSALKLPKHNHKDSDAGQGEAPQTSAEEAHGWQYGDLKAHGAGSPARKLQSHLAERLHRANRLPIRGALATVVVACLSMSLAGLYLMTIG